MFTMKRSAKAGLPPGTMVHIGATRAEDAQLSLMDYDEQRLVQEESTTIEACLPTIDGPSVTWLNIDGVHQTDVIERIGQHLHLHPLLLEDLVNTTQRPKLEDYGDYLFIVLKMLDFDEATREVKIEQVSLVLGRHYVLSFEEDPGDVFDAVRNRIRGGAERLRHADADYLAYSLIDAIVDCYFTILERLGDDLEELEAELVSHPSQETLQAIYRLKREVIALRRAVWPLREVIGVLERGESSLVQPATRVYLRDVYDHTIQVIDAIETMRDLLSGMLDIYLSGISNRMNEVMKVLTVFASIFIPLTFLAGVYGMNFHYMPELTWRWGYPLFWLLIITLVSAMLLYFRRKRWL